MTSLLGMNATFISKKEATLGNDHDEENLVKKRAM